MLKIENLEKKYVVGKKDVPVLKDVSVEINEGDFVMIMGESGSGKSTFLNCISTLDSPNSGAVSFEGSNLAAVKYREIEKLRLHSFGFIFQDNHMIDGLTILENVIVSRLQYDKDAETKGIELLEQLNIAHLKDNYPHQVSGGEKQRAAIARALVNDPKLIFADEPTASLNPKTAEQIMGDLIELNKAGQTIVMVTHSMRIASYGTRLLVLVDQNFIEDTEIEGDSISDRREFVESVVGKYL